MLSLASILNPAPSGPAAFTYFPPSPISTSPATSFADEPLHDCNPTSRTKVAKEAMGFAKSKVKGVINFYPFEDLDDACLREIHKFRVSPLSGIENYCRHIPYNSGKKDFYEKTGRESFEVFQYSFKVPGDDSEYVVMWDYNVGLVRMTPFFKCCKYSKTTPAKMLNLNPGLRDITHSITGGSIMAQGYWMPFSCAKAVCATFCHHIAGALIPIFGPKFPSECVHPDSPDYGRMIIDPAIVVQATREADNFRAFFANRSPPPPPPPSLPSSSSSPHPHCRPARFQDYYYDAAASGRCDRSRRQRFRKGMVVDSPYATDTDNEIPSSELTPPSSRYELSPPIPHPRTAAAGWTAVNRHHLLHYPPSHHHGHPHFHRPQAAVYHDEQQQYPGANPWLSAVPRLAPFGPRRPNHRQPPSSHPIQETTAAAAAANTTSFAATTTADSTRAPYASPSPVSPPRGPKRSAEHYEECYYDGRSGGGGGGDSGSQFSRESNGVGAGEGEGENNDEGRRREPRLPPLSMMSSGAEKNAALLLMNLSMSDADREAIQSREKESEAAPAAQELPSTHRSKRRRATSM